MPLFPSYLFAKLIISRSWHDVSFTRGVRSVVCFGGDPVPIEEEVISYIQSRVDEEGFVRLGEELSVGDLVVIKDGPFKTLTGVFKRGIAGKARVMILLSSLNYQAHIEVGRNLVKKIV
jgi:transcriptional antiterminator RfaH